MCERVSECEVKTCVMTTGRLDKWINERGCVFGWVLVVVVVAVGFGGMGGGGGGGVTSGRLHIQQRDT